MKKVFKHPKFIYGICLLVLDVAFFATTNPQRVPAPLLIIGFLLLVAGVYVLTRGILFAVRFYVPFVRNQKRLALFATLAFGVIIGMQSIGQLSGRDVVVLILLAVVFYLYAAYAKPRPT